MRVLLAEFHLAWISALGLSLPNGIRFAFFLLLVSLKVNRLLLV